MFFFIRIIYLEYWRFARFESIQNEFESIERSRPWNEFRFIFQIFDYIKCYLIA